jgi:hypothetical protein
MMSEPWSDVDALGKHAALFRMVLLVTNFSKLEMGDYSGKELIKMVYRHDAMLPSTPSRRIRPWKSAAPKCTRKAAKNR